MRGGLPEQRQFGSLQLDGLQGPAQSTSSDPSLQCTTPSHLASQAIHSGAFSH